MCAKEKTPESEREKFEKDLAALMAVPKAEVEALEGKRPKKVRKPKTAGEKS